MGKFRYMSPEQVEGTPLDRRSDIFSLGVVLWELLCGEALFSGGSLARLSERVRNAEVPPPSSKNPSLPPVLDEICLRALAKEPEARYARAGDLARALQQYLAEVAPGLSRDDLGAIVARVAKSLPGPSESTSSGTSHGRKHVISADPG